jgi:hypothetical protein
MKFAVHCAPPVRVCTPGWIVAVAAGAQAGAAPLDGVDAAANEAVKKLAATTARTDFFTAGPPG